MWLCSPETAAASALTGVITDPRALAAQLGLDYPTLALPERATVNTAMLEAPLPAAEAAAEELVKGSNIAALPDFPQLRDRIEAPVLLKVGDDVSTDEISPAGARALPFLIDEVHTALATSSELTLLTNTTTDERYLIRHRLSPLQVEMVLAGGQIRYWP